MPFAQYPKPFFQSVHTSQDVSPELVGFDQIHPIVYSQLSPIVSLFMPWHKFSISRVSLTEILCHRKKTHHRIHWVCNIPSSEKNDVAEDIHCVTAHGLSYQITSYQPTITSCLTLVILNPARLWDNVISLSHIGGVKDKKLNWYFLQKSTTSKDKSVIISSESCSLHTSTHIAQKNDNVTPSQDAVKVNVFCVVSTKI